VPHLLQAAETAAALGAYRDALDLLDECGEVRSGPHRPILLALRARVLAVLGDPQAIQAHREAAEATWGESRRVLLAGMARSAITTGDLETARAALDGLELDGGAADIPILLGRAYLAYLSGDLDGTLAETDLAQGRIIHSDVGWHMFDLVGLQAMVAHHRGEWNERLRFDIARSTSEPTIACLLFDGHLCVAEYLLYGPTPYVEVIDLALDLKRTAVQAGAARAEAFATTLAGEAALLSGQLDRAETLLQDAVDLHREIGATSGEAHSTQRLAEVLLARGDRERAERLLQRALRLARWSPLARHLVQRAYGALIRAAPDPITARALVDRAVAETGVDDQCMFCQVTLDIPAAIACAETGDVEAARRFLTSAEQSAANWSGTAWDAAVLEAKAHVLAAEGDRLEADVLLERAATTYAEAGQPLDAERCLLGDSGRKVGGRA
jgi:ATP/maltotriose-dependent transcriptional regulator MalT